MLVVERLQKSYRGSKAPVLRDVSLHVKAGQSVAIWGPSGGGKTTLLNLLGGLDRDFEGCIRLMDHTLQAMTDADLSRLRGSKIGFVFQTPPFFEHLNASQNLRLSARFRGLNPSQEQLEARLSEVGLAGFAGRFPHELSGGQQQRLALARACLGSPPLLLCDEPTGNLDPDTGQAVLDLILQRTEQQAAVLVVTHNREVAARCDRLVRMEQGRLSEDDA